MSSPDSSSALAEPYCEFPLILFDGECALCSGVVQLVLDNDRSGEIRFASLQSPLGKSYLEKFGLPVDDFSSYLVVEGNTYANKYQAVQRMVYHMGGGWRWLSYISHIIPRFLGDIGYTYGFRWRYAMFGHADSCRLLDPEQKHRFLDMQASVFKSPD